MKTILISFHADLEPHKPYARHAERLKEQCDIFGIESHIAEVSSKREWYQNTLYKPTFILQTLVKLKRPVFWLDVDNHIIKPLDLIDTLKCDVAAAAMPKNGLLVRVGTLYFNNTNPAKNFLKQWIKACGPAVKTGDHQPFSRTWKAALTTKSAKLKVLPHTWSSNKLESNTVIKVGWVATESKAIWSNNNKMRNKARQTARQSSKVARVAKKTKKVIKKPTKEQISKPVQSNPIVLPAHVAKPIIRRQVPNVAKKGKR